MLSLLVRVLVCICITQIFITQYYLLPFSLNVIFYNRSKLVLLLGDTIQGANDTLSRKSSLRAKFIAAQALVYLSQHVFVKYTSAGVGAAKYTVFDVLQKTTIADVSLRLKFFTCLVELTETRLQCSAEMLATAIGVDYHALAAPQGNTSLQSAADPSPLVRTWIHDEGVLLEAVELARSVLLAARCVDISMWQSLLMAMIHHGHDRAVVQTLVHLIGCCKGKAQPSQPAALLEKLFSREGRFTTDLVNHVLKFTDEILNKVDKVTISPFWSIVNELNNALSSIVLFGYFNHCTLHHQ